MVKKQFIKTVDVNVDKPLGAIRTASTLAGFSKPALLKWANGSNVYAEPDNGLDELTEDASVVFVFCQSGAVLLSVGDEAGQERPFIIPANFWREIAIPGGIAPGTRIVAKNAAIDANFLDLTIEVR